MKLIGIARLGRDAQVRQTSNGKSVANLAVAYDYGQKGADGHRPTQWIDASLWGDQALRLEQYLRKGTLLNLTCRDVHTEKYNSNQGEKTKLVATVLEIEFVPGQRQQAAKPSHPPATTKPSAASFDAMDDDIPF